eukprot:TRINITY_DN64302_c0_g1_i2.p1 TRINITY_DN64302_c0_g1~~TRINITY_DN64302_c0_g1_i2.p1  ORF type:complete len:422 (-),score=38.37 TRINITY_DN64302_c0_g1_i2:653-1918(-)
MRRLELTDEDFFAIKSHFDQCDKTLIGQLHWSYIKEHGPIQIQNVTIDHNTFNSIDVDKRGFITLLEVLRLLFPHVAVRDLQRFIVLELSADQIRKYKTSFHTITHGMGKLFAYDLDKAGEQFVGMKFTVKRLKRIKDSDKGLSLVQVMQYLHPRIPQNLIKKYLQTEITREEYALLVNDFKQLNPSGSDMVVLRDISKQLQGVRQQQEQKLQQLRQDISDSLYPQEDVPPPPPPTKNLGGVPFTMEMLYNIDKQKGGYIGFDDVLRALYPSISPELLVYYKESFNHAITKSPTKVTATTKVSTVAKAFTDFKKAEVLMRSMPRTAFEAPAPLPVYKYQQSFWQYPQPPRFDFEAWRAQSVWEEVQRRKEEEERKQAEILFKLHTAAAMVIQRAARRWVRYRWQVKRVCNCGNHDVAIHTN